MSQELHYTSAPRGLTPGMRGFCTVARTADLSNLLAERLESLSGYRQVFPPHHPSEALNPLVYSHLRMGNTDQSILSRIGFAGLDYSDRANKYAHHLVLSASERAKGGPAWLISQPGVMDSQWVGEPRILSAGRVVAKGDQPSGICWAWQQVAGDSGWAGALAQGFLDHPDRPSYLVYEPGVNLLPLFVEALALVPPERRWQVTFSTYYTGVQPGISCLWRGVLANTPEAEQALRMPGALVIDLTHACGVAPASPLAHLARTGEVQTVVEEAPIPLAVPELPISVAVYPVSSPYKLDAPPLLTGGKGGHKLESRSIRPPRLPGQRVTWEGDRSPRRTRTIVALAFLLLIGIGVAGTTRYLLNEVQSVASNKTLDEMLNLEQLGQSRRSNNEAVALKTTIKTSGKDSQQSKPKNSTSGGDGKPPGETRKQVNGCPSRELLVKRISDVKIWATGIVETTAIAAEREMAEINSKVKALYNSYMKINVVVVSSLQFLSNDIEPPTKPPSADLPKAQLLLKDGKLKANAKITLLGWKANHKDAIELIEPTVEGNTISVSFRVGVSIIPLGCLIVMKDILEWIGDEKLGAPELQPEDIRVAFSILAGCVLRLSDIEKKEEDYYVVLRKPWDVKALWKSAKHCIPKKEISVSTNKNMRICVNGLVVRSLHVVVNGDKERGGQEVFFGKSEKDIFLKPEEKQVDDHLKIIKLDSTDLRSGFDIAINIQSLSNRPRGLAPLTVLTSFESDSSRKIDKDYPNLLEILLGQKSKEPKIKLDLLIGSLRDYRSNKDTIIQRMMDARESKPRNGIDDRPGLGLSNEVKKEFETMFDNVAPVVDMLKSDVEIVSNMRLAFKVVKIVPDGVSVRTMEFVVFSYDEKIGD